MDSNDEGNLILVMEEKAIRSCRTQQITLHTNVIMDFIINLIYLDAVTYSRKMTNAFQFFHEISCRQYQNTVAYSENYAADSRILGLIKVRRQSV